VTSELALILNLI